MGFKRDGKKKEERTKAIKDALKNEKKMPDNKGVWFANGFNVGWRRGQKRIVHKLGFKSLSDLQQLIKSK